MIRKSGLRFSDQIMLKNRGTSMLPFRGRPQLITRTQFSQKRVEAIGAPYAMGAGTVFDIPVFLGAPGTKREVFAIVSVVSDSGSARTISSTGIDGFGGTASNLSASSTTHAVVRYPAPLPKNHGVLNIAFNAGVESGVVTLYRACRMTGYGGANSDSDSAVNASGTASTVAATTIPIGGFLLAAHSHQNVNVCSGNLLNFSVNAAGFLTLRAVTHGYLPLQNLSTTPSVAFNWSGSVAGFAASWAFS